MIMANFHDNFRNFKRLAAGVRWLSLWNGKLKEILAPEPYNLSMPSKEIAPLYHIL
jgi:hypothetical protein